MKKNTKTDRCSREALAYSIFATEVEAASTNIWQRLPPEKRNTYRERAECITEILGTLAVGLDPNRIELANRLQMLTIRPKETVYEIPEEREPVKANLSLLEAAINSKEWKAQPMIPAFETLIRQQTQQHDKL